MSTEPIDVGALARMAGVSLEPGESEAVQGVVELIAATFGGLDLSDVPEDEAGDPRWHR